jgi:uncharacterized protein
LTSLQRGYLAYIAPFAAYMLVTSVESRGWLGWPHEYELLCTFKSLLVTAVLIYFRREYPPLETRGWQWGLLCGIVGLPLWIALDRLQLACGPLQSVVESIMGQRAGYDPFSSELPHAAIYGVIALRLAELALVVPVMEELFWRGFLARILLEDDFRTAPLGQFTPKSFWIVTVAFASVHPEIVAALAWGALINLVFRRTASLWACILMHAVTNALLGGYILVTREWRLW